MAHQLICMLDSLCMEALQTLWLTSRCQGCKASLTCILLVHIELLLCLHHYKRILRPVSSMLTVMLMWRCTAQSCPGVLSYRQISS